MLAVNVEPLTWGVSSQSERVEDLVGTAQLVRTDLLPTLALRVLIRERSLNKVVACVLTVSFISAIDRVLTLSSNKGRLLSHIVEGRWSLLSGLI